MRATREYLAGVALAVLAADSARRMQMAWAAPGLGWRECGPSRRGLGHAGVGRRESGQGLARWMACTRGARGTCGYSRRARARHNTYSHWCATRSGAAWNGGAGQLATPSASELAICRDGRGCPSAQRRPARPSATSGRFKQGPDRWATSTARPAACRDGCQLMTVEQQDLLPVRGRRTATRSEPDGVDYTVVNVP